VVKAELGFALAGQGLVIGAGGFQQRERADDVGLDEFACAVDAAVNMAFGGKVHHRIGLVLGEDFIQRGAVADVGLHEGVSLAVCHAADAVQIACVGKFVQIDHAVLRVVDDVAHNGGADKACAACYEDFHVCSLGLDEGVIVVPIVVQIVWGC